MSEEAISENFHIVGGTFWDVMRNKMFWTDVFLLALIPYPRFHLNESSLWVWKDMATNWVDNSGDYSPHTHVYEVKYHIDDIMVALCLVRIYFILSATMT